MVGSSSSHAERHMANAAKKSGVTQTIIEANVAEDGTVTLKGGLFKKMRSIRLS